MTTPEVLFGVAGWSYPDWRGVVYPAGCKDTLRAVAAQLRTDQRIVHLPAGVAGDLPRNPEQFTERPQALGQLQFEFRQFQIVLVEDEFELFTDRFFPRHVGFRLCQQGGLLVAGIAELVEPLLIGGPVAPVALPHFVEECVERLGLGERRSGERRAGDLAAGQPRNSGAQGDCKCLGYAIHRSAS